MSKKTNDRTTFTCRIKAVDKDLATIAIFLEEQGVFCENKSQLASEGIRYLGRGLPDRYKVPTTIAALQVFSRLGYDPVVKGDKDYKRLTEVLKIEEKSDNMHASIQQFIQEQQTQETPEDVEQKNLSALRSGMVVPENVQVEGEE